MAKKRSRALGSPARRFVRAALKRLEESQFLFTSNYTTAAVYLAGYAVECTLKALILSNEPTARHVETMQSFRGTKAHDYGWLAKQLRRRETAVPNEVFKQLADVTWWNTDLRYEPREVARSEAREFLETSKGIIAWAKRSL
jgi:HEPN domain-containing protein